MEVNTVNKRKRKLGAGSYLTLVTAILALIVALVFLMTQADAAPFGHTGTTPGIVLLVGAAVSLLLFCFPVGFVALVSVGTYGFAFYLMVVQLYIVFADVINNVTYAGGNLNLCMFYMIGTFAVLLLSAIGCFLKRVSDEDEEAMSRRALTAKVLPSLLSVAVVACAVAALFLIPGAGRNASIAASASGPFRMNYADNPFVGKTIEELAAIPRTTWEEKEAKGEVAYFFEGQYTEGFSTIVDPACLDMYCCKDGSMYGSFSGPDTSVGMGSVTYVYGYWYNYDEKGERNFVIHLVGDQDANGTRPVNIEGGADADVFIFDTNHGAYSWEASMSYGVMGGMITRNINIYGQEYAPAQRIEIDASGLRTFYTGDSLDPTELKVTAIRANGASEDIWNGRLAYSGFDSETTGKKNVTGSFLGASFAFEANVEELVTENYAGTYELVKDDAPTAMEAVLLVDYSHKVCTVTANDGSAAISGTLVDVKDGALTITLNGSAPIDAPITEADGGKQITIPAHQEVVSGWGFSNTYDIGECAFAIAE